MRKNPKYSLNRRFGEDLDFYRSLPAGLFGKNLGSGFSIRLSEGRTVGVTRLGGRDSIADVDESAGEIRLRRTLMSPTTIHWLFEFLSAYAERLGMLDYELLEYQSDDGRYADTGYSVRRFLTESRMIKEEGVVRYSRDPSKSQLKSFEYRVLITARDMTWYHATLERYLPSILKDGLLPSGIGKEKRPGWSEGWNEDLQRAVYVTSKASWAAAIAKTLASRFDEDAFVLEVDGAGFKDLKRLTFDEDAMRSLSTVTWGTHDKDFPPWVTGFGSGRPGGAYSVAYMGKIEPQYIRVFAKYSPPDPTEGFDEQDYEWGEWDDCEEEYDPDP